MKKEIHPTYYPEAKVSCACGNEFTLGATMSEVRVELCSKCHPAFTGKMKLVDTARRLDMFETRLAKTKAKQEAAGKSK